MKRVKRLIPGFTTIALAVSIAYGCGFDVRLREYLSESFWYPFSRSAVDLRADGVERVSVPFAGMTLAESDSPIERLRASYQRIARPMPSGFLAAEQLLALRAAAADVRLSEREREEVALIDAKIDMRLGGAEDTGPLLRSRDKLERFLETATDPAFQSEARGWLARVHFLLGDRAEAAKLYLDELNRDGSNISESAVLASLRMVYPSYSGGMILNDMEAFFDTPKHATFAVLMATNPNSDANPAAYARAMTILDENHELLASGEGAAALTILLMRTALRMGDPSRVIDVAQAVGEGDPIREDEEFRWMLASAQFVSGDYAATEATLLDLFNSDDALADRVAAATGLVGVYQKTGNTVEQLHYALWLDATHNPTQESPQFVYWQVEGFDLLFLLDVEASIEDLERFIATYPEEEFVRVVQYSLAVRLTRENRYREAADIYEQIQAVRRAPRMRGLADLYERTLQTGLTPEERLEARYDFAERLTRYPDGVYFNDAVWFQRQSAALSRYTNDYRLGESEQEAALAAERALRDSQEERWRAYQILRGVVEEAGRTALGRRAAELALRCLREIRVDRFGRQEEIRQADVELSAWLAG